MGERMSSTAQPGTIGRLWQDACRAGFARPAFLAQRDDGWSPVSWDEAERRVEELAAGFAATGIDRGDRVALLARTRLEWTLVDMAVSSIGAVLVPIYPTASADEVNHIVSHCGVSLLVAENARQLRRATPAETLATLVIEGEGDGSLADLAARGREMLAREPDAVSRRRDQVEAGDVLTYLLYVGHHRVAEGLRAHAPQLHGHDRVGGGDGGIGTTRRLAAAVPAAGPQLRAADAAAGNPRGCAASFCLDFIGVPAALQAVRPTLLPAVPRFYERVVSQVQAEIDSGSAFRRAIAGRALAAGRRAAVLRREGRRPGPLLRAQLALADRVVWSRVRDRFGGQLRFGVSGGAALPQAVAELFDAIGITVLEGYGLSEATCASHFNRPGRQRRAPSARRCPESAAGWPRTARSCWPARRYSAATSTSRTRPPPCWETTAGCTPATSARSTRTATCASSTARRSSSSPPAARTSTPEARDRRSRPTRWCRRRWWWGDGRPYLVALIAPDLAEVQRLGLDRVPGAADRRLRQASQPRGRQGRADRPTPRARSRVLTGCGRGHGHAQAAPPQLRRALRRGDRSALRRPVGRRLASIEGSPGRHRTWPPIGWPYGHHHTALS